MNFYIVGGGASGMLLSILLKKYIPEINIVILEKNDRLGRKLLATGNGRCNFTNINLSKFNFHSDNSGFPWDIISKFNNYDLISLFEELGIYSRIEPDGRVFPLSLQGSSVLDILRLHIEDLGVGIIYNENIKQIKRNKEGTYLLKGKYNQYLADKVIIATGGLAMPNSGSTGTGYDLGKSLGHTIIDTTPAIVQLKSDYERIRSISGIRIDTEAKLFIDNEQISTSQGDVLFTNDGLSGPAIFDLSRTAIMALKDNNTVSIGVNISGAENIEEVLHKKLKFIGEVELSKFLIGIIHTGLIKPFIETWEKLYPKYSEYVINDRNYIKNLSALVQNYSFNITGYRDYNFAQTTTGGINTRELKDTLESKYNKNLYFIGEVVDVDGDCGGYNLQWAWTSAYTAANDIVNKYKDNR